MMIQVTPWEFYSPGNGITAPVDEELHQQAVAFCKENLSGDLDPRKFHKLWVARLGKTITGVTGVRNAIDIPVFRSIHEPSTWALGTRINSYLADNGRRGEGVFLYLNERETVEMQCPNRASILTFWAAQPSDRYEVTVR